MKLSGNLDGTLVSEQTNSPNLDVHNGDIVVVRLRAFKLNVSVRLVHSRNVASKH